MVQSAVLVFLTLFKGVTPCEKVRESDQDVIRKDYGKTGSSGMDIRDVRSAIRNLANVFSMPGHGIQTGRNNEFLMNMLPSSG